MIHGCICDSSWTVGLNSGEKQVGEWFGPDCSLRRCPSGDDPMTDEDETDCENKRQNDLTLVLTEASHIVRKERTKIYKLYKQGFRFI